MEKEYDRELMFTMRSGQMICWVNLIVMFRRPARPVLLTSLLSNPEKLKPWEILSYAIPHILVWWTMWSIMHLYAIHLVTYISGTVAVTKALGHQNQQWYRRRDTRQSFAKMYRGMQILLQKFDSAIGPPLAAHKVIFGLMIIRSMYGALTQSGEVRILQAIIGTSGWLYLQMAFKNIGSVSQGCEEMLFAWKPMGKDPWFGRFLKSCKQLRVGIAGLYYVDKQMSLTLASIILDRIVNMLIAEQQ